MFTNTLIIYFVIYTLMAIGGLALNYPGHNTPRFNKIAMVIGAVGLVGMFLVVSSLIYTLTTISHDDIKTYTGDVHEITFDKNNTPIAITDDNKFIELPTDSNFKTNQPITYTAGPVITAKWFGIATIQEDVFVYKLLTESKY